MASAFRVFLLLSLCFCVVYGQQTDCCCVLNSGYVLVRPNDVTMECLFAHDYGAVQYQHQYTGYAAAVDICALQSTCPCALCIPPATVGTWTDLYEITGTDSTSIVCGNSRTIRRTFTIGCGASVTQTITVSDTTPPELYIPDDMTAECFSYDGIAGPDLIDYGGEFGSARATDLCTNPTLTESDNLSLDTACTTILERTFIANDQCFQPSMTQTITITDTLGPEVLLIEGSLTYQCNDPAVTTVPPILYPQVYDACENYASTTTSAFDSVTYPGRCTGEYTMTRVWKAQDACGNIGVSAPQIIYVIDNEPPSVVDSNGTPVSNIYTTYTCSPITILSTPSFTITDNCATASNLYLTYDETVDGIIDYESNYDIIRDYVASDDCGNSRSWREVAHIQLRSFLNLTAPVNSIAVAKGTQVDVTFNLYITTLCKTTYIVFDYGVATLNAITFSGVGATCSNSGAALICPYSIFPTTNTNVPIVLTLTVPTSYQPNSLEIQASIIEGGVTTDFAFETPGLSSVLLVLS